MWIWILFITIAWGGSTFTKSKQDLLINFFSNKPLSQYSKPGIKKSCDTNLINFYACNPNRPNWWCRISSLAQQAKHLAADSYFALCCGYLLCLTFWGHQHQWLSSFFFRTLNLKTCNYGLAKNAGSDFRTTGRRRIVLWSTSISHFYGNCVNTEHLLLKRGKSAGKTILWLLVSLKPTSVNSTAARRKWQ